MGLSEKILATLNQCLDIKGHWINLRFLWHTRSVFRHFLAGMFFTGMLSAVMWLYIDIKEKHDDLHCLALNIYHESRGEPLDGQYAVAQVTLNRVASKNYPRTICKVVYQQNWDRIRKRMVGAFSWTELQQLRQPSGGEWETAVRVAEDTYNNQKDDLVSGALFYHSKYVKPSWARKKKIVAKHGKHLFYR